MATNRYGFESYSERLLLTYPEAKFMTFCLLFSIMILKSSLKELLAWLFRMGIKLRLLRCALMLACWVLWHIARFKKISPNYIKLKKSKKIKLVSIYFAFIFMLATMRRSDSFGGFIWLVHLVRQQIPKNSVFYFQGGRIGHKSFTKKAICLNAVMIFESYETTSVDSDFAREVFRFTHSTRFSRKTFKTNVF